MIGIDEAGRGPLAGPVAVGIVLAPKGFSIRKAFPGVADSKKLSEKKREHVFALLKQHSSVRYLVVFASAKQIDRVGIAKAIGQLVTKGIRTIAPDATTVRVLLDGSLKAPAEYRQKTIIRGDASEPIISLASIAAKVSRDRLMQKLAKKYPEYGFEIHKGYGTRAHYAALKKYGASPIHRRSFNLCG